MDDKFCKGCSTSVHITKEELEKLFEKNVKITGVKLVSKDTHEKRIQLCKK